MARHKRPQSGKFFSAESLGKFSLVSCIVTPGFNFKDFQLISKDEFLMQYPQHQTLSKFIRNKANKSDYADSSSGQFCFKKSEL